MKKRSRASRFDRIDRSKSSRADRPDESGRDFHRSNTTGRSEIRSEVLEE